MITIDGKIEDEKSQYDTNVAAAKISWLSSSSKIDKEEYLKGEELLSTQQHSLKEDAKLSYSLLGKVFEKQLKTIEEPLKS